MIAGCEVLFRFGLAKVTVKRKRDMSLHFLNYRYRHATFRVANAQKWYRQASFWRNRRKLHR